jgi:hypothetical protein
MEDKTSEIPETSGNPMPLSTDAENQTGSGDHKADNVDKIESSTHSDLKMIYVTICKWLSPVFVLGAVVLIVFLDVWWIRYSGTVAKVEITAQENGFLVNTRFNAFSTLKFSSLQVRFTLI